MNPPYPSRKPLQHHFFPPTVSPFPFLSQRNQFYPCLTKNPLPPTSPDHRAGFSGGLLLILLSSNKVPDRVSPHGSPFSRRGPGFLLRLSLLHHFTPPPLLSFSLPCSASGLAFCGANDPTSLNTAGYGFSCPGLKRLFDVPGLGALRPLYCPSGLPSVSGLPATSVVSFPFY